jgi:hypothetical protein
MKAAEADALRVQHFDATAIASTERPKRAKPG